MLEKLTTVTINISPYVPGFSTMSTMTRGKTQQQRAGAETVMCSAYDQRPLPDTPAGMMMMTLNRPIFTARIGMPMTQRARHYSHRKVVSAFALWPNGGLDRLPLYRLLCGDAAAHSEGFAVKIPFDACSSSAGVRSYPKCSWRRWRLGVRWSMSTLFSVGYLCTAALYFSRKSHHKYLLGKPPSIR